MKTKTKMLIANKQAHGGSALIKNAMAVMLLCAMLISEVPFSLMQIAGPGEIPANVYAASGDPGIVESSRVLAGYANEYNAQTVYYAGTGWRVLSYGNTGNHVLKSEDKMTLLASNSLAQCMFNPDRMKTSDHYAGSVLQSTVDNWYTTNFSDKEKSAVAGRDLAVQGYWYDAPYTNGVAGSEVKNAKLWPLSTREAFYTGKGSKADTTPLDYSALRDIGIYWWFRSPGRSISDILFSVAGAADRLYPLGISVDRCGDGEGGVRPAFMLNLLPVLFTSAASDSLGKPAGNIGTLNAVNNNNGSEWKLTLLDDGTVDGLNGHAGFNAQRIGSERVNAGSNIQIRYSGAQIGNNEYVSAYIKDSNDKIRYYGHLAKSSSDGTAVLTLPNDINLEAGKYMVGVFAEQCNGDKKTDYASNIARFPVTIATHKHDFTFSAGTGDDANTITARCSGTDIPCSLALTMTINKPKKAKNFFSLDEASATLGGLSDFKKALGRSIDESNITYEGIEGTDYAESLTPPTGAGKYRARFTLNDVKTAAGDKQSVTAYVDYEISKANGFIAYYERSVTKALGDKPFINEMFIMGDGKVTYTSSDENVATVDSKGKVTIVGPGTAVIRATAADGKEYTYTYPSPFGEASYILTVKEKSDDISASISPESLKKARLTSVRAKKGGKAVVRWRKSAGADGYQLSYKAKGVKARKLTVKNAKTVKKTVKKLKAGKTYSFRIRTFTNVKKLKAGKIKTVKVYGKWSNVKKVKAK